MILVSHRLTEATSDDATTALDLLTAVGGPLVRVTADAAYDTVAVYETATARGATVVIPPLPWCTTRDLGKSLPSTPRSEVPHDEFQAHPAEGRPEGLPCPELAGVRDGSPRSRESDRLVGLTDGKLANWNSPRPTRRKPGRQRKYSNHAIETTVTLGLVFGLASRQTEGFLRSLLTLLNLDNDVPDHSTISRRKARLGKVASYERRTVKPVGLEFRIRSLNRGLGHHCVAPEF